MLNGQFHLIDRHAVGGQFDRLGDAIFPVVPRFADHAGDQVDVDVRKAGLLDPVPGFVNFARQMGPTVFFEHAVAEILDSQTESRNAQIAQRLHLGLRERARLALEGDFFGVVPIDVGPQAIDERRELLAAEKRRGTATEIDEAKRPLAHHRQAADQFDLVRQGRDVAFDVVRVLIGIDAKVTELAALAAERNVQVQAERRVGPRRRIQGSAGR